MEKLIKKLTSQKTNPAAMRKELARAHLVIALLCIANLVFLTLGSIQEVPFEPILSAVSTILLCFVIFISTCISYKLFSNKK